MVDDEIVFLGTFNPSSPALTHPPAQRPVTGIALHVEKCNGLDAFGMLFRKTNTSVVHIGRRSGNDSDRRSQDNDHNSAMFRCAVVSRKHAKIAFSDSGHAFLIDLGSHHGTHIRKTAERYSKTLKPEVPAMLCDGDIITFGKSVGKNEECVRPVVARVELLYSGQNSALSTTSIRPLVVPSTSPLSDKSTGKSNAGRYGIHSSSSSDDSSGYSDIEEIPSLSASPSKPPPAPPARTSNALSRTGSSSFVNAMDVLKRFLPPIRTPPSPTTNKPVSAPAPQIPSLSSLLFHSYPAEGFADGESGPSDSLNVSIEVSPPRSEPADADVSAMPENRSNRSRSNSPMDLASPSPTPEVVVSRRLSIPPLSVSPVLRAASLSQSGDNDSVSAMSAISSAASSGTDKHNDDVDDEESSYAISSQSGRSDSGSSSPEVEFEDNRPTAEAVRRLQNVVGRLESDVIRLQSHRRKYRSRFNNNVQVISQKLSQFDDRIAEINAEYTVLYDQVDAIHHADIPDIQAQCEALQERMDDYPSPFSTPAPEPRLLFDDEKMEGVVKTVNELSQEMRTLREAVRNEVQSEIEALRKEFTSDMNRERDRITSLVEQVGGLKGEQIDSMNNKFREELMLEIIEREKERDKVLLEAASAAASTAVAAASATATQDNQPVLPSLKRKRDDTDENEGVVDMEMDTSDDSREASIDEECHDANGPPPRKRTKRFISLVAQTATAVTIGAVVTWSALAFS